MAQIPGGNLAKEKMVLSTLNKQLESQVEAIVFGPFQTVVSQKIMRDQLDKYFPYIKIVVNAVNTKLPGYVVQVTGYANPPGDKTTQKAKDVAMRISKARANSVRAALIRKGLKASVLVAVGAGDADRVTASYDNDKAAWGKNRRVILKIVKK